MRERWVVISNCQTFGLADCLTALSADIDVEAYDIYAFRDRIAEDRDYFRRYDFALVLPEAREIEGFWADALPANIDVPAFVFGGYHPDCCYVFADGAVLDGLIGPYNSMIALAAYKEGLDAEAASRFFTEWMYKALGYDHHWHPYRDHMIAQYSASGLDVAPLFRRLGRGHCFMHTNDHPKIELFYAIAQLVLESRGKRVLTGAPLPTDRLAGMQWPVYPEIGECLGVPGAYLFRPSGAMRPLALRDYLDAALVNFGRWDKSQLRVIPAVQRRLQTIRRLIREAL